MKKGFTLIELLIVIAIIGILSSMVIVSVTNIRSKSRDTQRKADLRQVKASLEIYYADQTPNLYVVAETAIAASDTIFGGSGQSYMKNIPLDPSRNNENPGSGRQYMYQTDAAGKNFLLTCDLENDSDSERNTAVPTGSSYTMPTGHDFWVQND